MTMSKWLFDSHPIVVDRELAKAFGLNEAIVLQQLNYWLNGKSAKLINGRKWIYNSYKQWQEDNFPFWSLATVRRAIENCEKKGLIITGNFNKAGFDKTKWYSIDYDMIDRGMSKRCAQNEQTSCSKCADGVAQDEQTNTRDYTEITSEITTNKQADAVSADADLSESFNKLWNLYPKKQGKKDAFRHYKAWRKKSKDNTDDYLLRKLNEYKAYLAANKWLHPMNGSTWFNGRFDDDYSIANSQGYQPPQQPQSDGGFAQKLVDGKWTQNEINVAVKGIKNLSPQQKAYYVQPIDQEGNTRYRLDYLAGKAIPISDALDRL